MVGARSFLPSGFGNAHFSGRPVHGRDPVLGLRRIERTALSAVVTQFQPVN